MLDVRISVFDKTGSDESLTETRFVSVESARKMTGSSARRILLREFPEIKYIWSLSKTDEGFEHTETLRPTKKCDYHYIWRRYLVSRA